MFKITSDFSKGVYDNYGRVNGFSAYVMESQELTDALIENFEKYIVLGYNPNVIYEDVFRSVGCSEKDLTDFDKQRLKRKVEQIWKNQKK